MVNCKCRDQIQNPTGFNTRTLHYLSCKLNPAIYHKKYTIDYVKKGLETTQTKTRIPRENHAAGIRSKTVPTSALFLVPERGKAAQHHQRTVFERTPGNQYDQLSSDKLSPKSKIRKYSNS